LNIIIATALDFPAAGVTGTALIFHYFFELPIGMATVVLNIPIIIICGKLLGKIFF